MNFSLDVSCPKCQSEFIVKSGIVNNKQRYKCKDCTYNFTVQKIGKRIDEYYIIKAIQLYLEGLSAREIERLLGISHASVLNYIHKLGIQKINIGTHRNTYKVFNHEELSEFLAHKNNLKGFGAIITEVGDKYMMIRWERFKS
ncbi:MAG: hypothetical protein MUE53_09130 [Chitinophagales bacterium]|jgi:transposase-like protein|nr:hypothetical protein [Chitinophagales bacterium]